MPENGTVPSVFGHVGKSHVLDDEVQACPVVQGVVPHWQASLITFPVSSFMTENGTVPSVFGHVG